MKLCYQLLFISLFVFVSCKKELKAPIPAKFDAGILSSSKDTVNIDAANPANEAVKFSWTAPANSLVAYSLVLSAAGKTDTVRVPQASSAKSFTNAELNNTAVTKFGLAVGVVSEIKVIAIASVTINTNSAVSNQVTVKVKPAPTGPPYTKLWIVGDATPNGWDIDNPNKMKVDPRNAFQFTYNEVLSAGEFKIPVTTGNWNADFFMPLVNHPAINNTAVKLTPGGQPDNKWQISAAGAYKILLNISTAPSIKITPFTPYPALWLVGDATPAGWNIDAPTPMVQTTGNVYEFTYTGPLTAGEFKIPTTTGNWNTDYFMPPANGAGITETNAVFIAGGNPDNKWKITDAGNYKITVNQLAETILIEKN